MADRDGDDEKVGYGRPPKRHQFKPGQSGNPKGRAKGSKNAATIFSEEASATAPIMVRGKRRNVELLRLNYRQSLHKGAAGDLRAIQINFNEAHRFAEKEASAGSPSELTSEQDREFQELVRRIRGLPDDDQDGGP